MYEPHFNKTKEKKSTKLNTGTKRMKFLEIAAVDAVNNAMAHLEFSDCRVLSRIEVYSCKAIASDKKLYKQLETRYGNGAVEEAMQETMLPSPSPIAQGLVEWAMAHQLLSQHQTQHHSGSLGHGHGHLHSGATGMGSVGAAGAAGSGFHPYRKRSHSGVSGTGNGGSSSLSSSLNAGMFAMPLMPPAFLSKNNSSSSSYSAAAGLANSGNGTLSSAMSTSMSANNNTGSNSMGNGSFSSSLVVPNMSAAPGSLGSSLEDRFNVNPTTNANQNLGNNNGTFQQSRKTFFYLISTLNSSFPDYDFSNVKPEQFTRQPCLETVVNSINTTLRNATSRASAADLNQLLRDMWSAIDSALGLADCEIYSYNSDMETDPYAEIGNIWSFNYFFYSRKQKRVVFFTCRAVSFSAQIDEQGYQEDRWDDSYVAGEMDDF